MIGIGKFPRKGCRLEDREMDGYAMLYRAYLARRDLPGPEPTFADFVTIRQDAREDRRTVARKASTSL